MPATQTPPTAGKCLPARRCPAAAGSLPVNCPTVCWSFAGAADRRGLPTRNRCHPLACSWHGHAAEPSPAMNHPWGLHRCFLPGWPTKTTTVTVMACRRTIPACGRCCCCYCCFLLRSATTMSPVEPTRNACPSGDIRRQRIPSVPASARATG